MRKHRIAGALAAVAGASLMLAGSVSAQSPSAPAAAGSPGTGSTWKIGVVPDIGTLDDKNYNEYTNKGAQAGAAAIGAAVPDAVVPKSADEYKADIQNFVDNGYNLIVTTGFNLAGDTAQAAHDNPKVWFVGVDQSPICVDEQGNADPNFGCKGDAKTLLPNYISIEYQEDQAGYLAGIVAASVSKTGSIAAIGGTDACAPCVRYIQGYELGAKSVNPNIKVNSAYVVHDFSTAAFNDPTTGATFAQQLLTTYPDTDVIFQVAGKTGNGVLATACAAKIAGIGVDVDQYVSLNSATDPTYGCVITSAEKHLVSTVSQAIEAIAGGTAVAGDSLYNAANDGIGVADFHGAAVPADVQAKLDAALAAMKATPPLVTCPADSCGVVAK